MLLALTGFVMIGLLMYFLLKGKAIPVTLFVVLPIIGALINGFGIADITDYIKSGVSTTWGMACPVRLRHHLLWHHDRCRYV